MNIKSTYYITLLLLMPTVAFAAPEGAMKEQMMQKIEAPGQKGFYKAEQTEDGPLARRVTKAIEVIATIEALDLETRKVTLKTPEKTFQFKVSDKVQRLNEFKVGDKVVTQYIESLAFEVRDATEAELKNPRQVAAGAAKNPMDLPAGMEAGVLEHVIVEIEDINLDTNMVTVKLPEGNSVAIKAKVPENLKRVKVGDTVAVSYAEALAISIAPHKG